MKEYIEREDAVKHLKSRTGQFIDDVGKGWNAGIEASISYIEGLPAADVAEVRHGRWIFEPGKIPYCSECKEYSDDGDKGATFCPWCGARMDKEAEQDAD